MSIVQNNGFPAMKMAQQVRILSEFKYPEAMGKKTGHRARVSITTVLWEGTRGSLGFANCKANSRFSKNSCLKRIRQTVGERGTPGTLLWPS